MRKKTFAILICAWSVCACASAPVDRMPGGDVIAFDYDGTCSSTPELCVDFFRVTHQRGLTPVILTARARKVGGPVEKFASDASSILGFHVPVIFAAGRAKSLAAKEAGFDVALICDNRSASRELKTLGVIYVCGPTVPPPSFVERLQRLVFSE